jgi:aspartate carbamoyltransferase catalytic subunit
VINLDVARSSTAKGETLFDTAANLDAMGADAIIVRHSYAGLPQLLARYVKSVIINAGDGAHQHPTQALLDLFTLFQRWGGVEGKKVAIVGDIRNSRVANSNIQLLTRFGAEVILVGPPQFLPQGNYRRSYRLEEVIDEVDAVMALRTQTERHKAPTLASLHDYAVLFKIDEKLIAEKDILVLHPGPVHRNVDISDEVLASPKSVVLEQVRNGVAVRMGILKFLLG